MSQNPPPQDDGSTKLILNGTAASDVIIRLCSRIYDRFEDGKELPHQMEIRKKLNALENLGLYTTYRFLQLIGDTGPLPLSLQFTDEQAKLMDEFSEAMNKKFVK